MSTTVSCRIEYDRVLMFMSLKRTMSKLTSTLFGLF